jgi:uncharacterized protein YjbJ (UPF0337 family)
LNQSEGVVDWQEVYEQWPQLKGSARVRWDRLSNTDLDKVGGIRDQLVGMVEERYQESRDEAERACDEWVASLPPVVPRSSMAG